VLTQPEVASYLLRRGLLSAEAVVDGDLTVVDSSRRNDNCKVVSDVGPSYHLKQGPGPHRLSTVAREAAVYRLLGSLPEAAAFRPYIPHCHGYDPEHDLLILDLLTAAEDFRQYHARRRHFSLTLARSLGRALSELHKLRQPALADVDHSPLSTALPWALELDLPSLALYREASNANLQLIRVAQSAPDLGQLLAELRAGWQHRTLIHNDIKWDNCLVFGRGASERRTRLNLVDWEFAAVGDPCWDVGGVFSNYLSFWLNSIPITGEDPPDRFLEISGYPLQRMQPAMRAYWDAYVQGARLDPAIADRWLLTAVKYAAARLIQTGFEQMQSSTQLAGNVVCLLQLSLNMLQRPREATAHLLGIPLKAGWWP